MTKRALITGITGQDGSYLAELLLEKGYHVIGMVRRSSTLNFERIGHLQDQLELVPGDLLDEVSMIQILRAHRPDEVYNLAAQSFVQTSFGQPVLTGETTALGVTRILDAIRLADHDVRFYQASSQRDVRQGRRGAPEGVHPLLPPLPLRRRQALRPLDHGELPRELRHARQLAASCSTTRAPAAASSSSPARSPTAWPASSSASTPSCASATSTPSATGASPATTSTPCGACCSRTSRATSWCPPARPTRCASSARWRSATST